MPNIEQGSVIRLTCEPNDLYVKRTKKPTLSSNGLFTFRIPKRLSCIIARVLHGFLCANLVVARRAGSNPKESMIDIELNAPMGKQLVALELDDDEVLSFDLEYLVAFSRDLKLWTEIEFSWSAFGVHRNFIQNAQGPGRVVFEINGKGDVSGGRQVAFSPCRLVAWTPKILFGFCGIRSYLDMYLNDILVETKDAPDGSILVLDADMHDGQGATNRLRNLWEMLKRVYWPL